MPAAGVQLAVLACIVIAVFLPSLFAEYSTIDDLDTLAWLAKQKVFSLKDIFFPTGGAGGYYRPIQTLSQYADRFLWDLDPLATHMENVVLHLLNTVWVFFLARAVVDKSRRRTSCAPLLAGLVFGLHPATTESINWYSGRTDLLAGFFGFPALYAGLVWNETRKGLALPVLSIACALLGLLSKEAVLGFFIAFPLLLLDPRSADGHGHLRRWRIYLPLFALSFLTGLFYFRFWPSILLAIVCFFILFSSRTVGAASGPAYWLPRLLRLATWMTAVTAVVAAGSYGVRRLVFNKQLPIFWQTVIHIAQDPEYAGGQFMGALAFYVKKFFVPVPLNFAIREIDPSYSLAGIALLFVTVLMILNRSRASLFFLAGMVALSPALPFVFGIIAWTSYAERYMYLAVGLWAVSIALVVEAARYRRAAAGLTAAVVVVFAVLTFNRNCLWQSNIAMIADTVEKSPRFKLIRGTYLELLYANGRYEEALQQYHIAVTLPDVGYNPEYDLLYAHILYKMGEKDQARKALDLVESKSKKYTERVRQVRSSLKLQAPTTVMP